MLEVRGLVAGYGEVEVIRGLDLSVQAGQIVAVLGANGVGKTERICAPVAFHRNSPKS